MSEPTIGAIEQEFHTQTSTNEKEQTYAKS